jgi:FtsZ-interacting cell division protein YlmF
MGAISQVIKSFNNVWGHGDDDYIDELEEGSQDGYAASAPQRESKYSASTTPLHGGSSGGAVRKFHPVAAPIRSAREKNIYAMKPKSLDEVSLAADYLKEGCAVLISLEDVERSVAIRIIDFMSGVCYGLELQGHAMKVQDTIFLFTPGDFEISSDEADYGENRGLIFKDAVHSTPAAVPAAVASQVSSALGASRPWER